MKTLKKALAVLLVVMLFLSISIPAFAVNTQYSTTKEFLSVLSREKLKYRYMGVGEDDKEEVTLSYTGDNWDDIFINIFFDEDLDSVSLRCWNIVDFDEKDRAEALELCNRFNNEYKYVKFVMDENDWSIGAEMDVPIREGEESAECVYDALYYIVTIADDAYPELSKIAK